MQIFRFRRQSDVSQHGFLALPAELRMKVYGFCFHDSHTRYWRQKLLRHNKLIKVAYCEGPKEHAFLASCRQVYEEASEILVESAYFLLDKTNTQAALISIQHCVTSGSFSKWLTRLVNSTRRLVLSKIGPNIFWNQRPIFESLEYVELFGFYPTLQRWLKRNRTVSMGWGMWYW